MCGCCEAMIVILLWLILLVIHICFTHQYRDYVIGVKREFYNRQIHEAYFKSHPWLVSSPSLYAPFWNSLDFSFCLSHFLLGGIVCSSIHTIICMMVGTVP